MFPPFAESSARAVAGSGNPSRSAHPLSFLLDPGEVLHAELVYRAVFQVQRGPRQDLGRVHRFAAGEGAESDGLGGVREVLAKRRQEALQGRHGALAEDPGHALSTGRVGSGDRHDGRRRIGRRGHQSLDLSHRALHHHPGGGHARTHAITGHLGQRVEEDRRGREPGEVAIQALRGVGPLERPELAEELAWSRQVAHDLEPVQAVLDLGEVAPGDGLEHVECRPYAHVADGAAVDPVEVLEGPPMQGFPPGPALLARVGEPVVEPLVPDQRAEERVVLEQALPICVDQGSTAIDRVIHVSLQAGSEPPILDRRPASGGSPRSSRSLWGQCR